MPETNDNKIILQNILFPDEDTCAEPLMYYRDNGNVRAYNGYFNIFSIHKWLHFTTLKQLCLHVEAAGSYEVRVVNEAGRLLAAAKSYACACETGAKEADDENGEKSTAALSASASADAAYRQNTAECGGVTAMDITVPYNDTDNVLWFELISDETELRSAYYYTTDPAVTDVRLALDICTFKREPYVIRNMTVLREAILDNPASPLYGRMDVFIVDNGQTLLDNEEFIKLLNGSIRVFPNMNAGGAGGFTRGLIEILRRKDAEGYTHMIFLDDDAVQQPDSFIRTAAFMSLVKPEYADASIAGSMLRLDRRHILHEAGAIWTGSEPRQPHQGTDLTVLDEVIANEEIYDIDYGAWFYCCYPLSVMNFESLPLPIFIHMDDIEFGLRNHNGVIAMNGICVWHDAFDFRRSSSMGYYDMRNSLIMNAVHDRDKSAMAICKNLLRACIGDCFRYRYDDFDIKCYAIDEFMRGPEYIGSLDPVAKNTEVSKLGYRNKPVDELTDNAELLDRMHRDREESRKRRLYAESESYEGSKKKYWLTFNGLIFPAAKKEEALPMNTSPYAIYRVKSLILYDPEAQTGFRVERSLGKAASKLIKCVRYQLKLITGYSRGKAVYKRDIHKLREIGFWESYLGL